MRRVRKKATIGIDFFFQRHNAVALDLVISAPKDKCYTLIGDELDEDGKIKSPKRLDWHTGQAFTTPLGLWHSHHNESENEDAWILPVQDAGLSLHQVTLFPLIRRNERISSFIRRAYTTFDLQMRNGNISTITMRSKALSIEAHPIKALHLYSEEKSLFDIFCSPKNKSRFVRRQNSYRRFPSKVDYKYHLSRRRP